MGTEMKLSEGALQQSSTSSYSKKTYILIMDENKS